MPDISVVITGHREGIIAGPSIKSALTAVEYAQKCHGLRIEIVSVLDRPDQLTRDILNSGLSELARIFEVDVGDPGLSRNYGVRASSGKYVAFLDADDLWSFNWLANAWRIAEGQPDAVWHSECNITFGRENCIWWHVDSESALFDRDHLSWGNYWDALSFARRSIYLEYPFRPNNLAEGFGHEDWDWNRLTLSAGLQHKPVLDTVHFKRRRLNSQMARVHQSDSVVRPLPPTRLNALQRSNVSAVCIDDAFYGQLILRDALFRHERYISRASTYPHTDIVDPSNKTDRAILEFHDKLADINEDITKAIVILHNPLERAAALLAHRAYESGNYRGAVADETLVSLFSATHSSAAERLNAARERFGDNLLVVAYDRLIAEQEDVLREIDSFLGLTPIPTIEAISLARPLSPLPSFSEEQRKLLAFLLREEADNLATAQPDLAALWAEEIRAISSDRSAHSACNNETDAISRLLRVTESLGDNCEFGFVQRNLGYEPSSLFRWAVANIDDLINYLESPSRLYVQQNLKVNNSALVYDSGSGFYFHSELIQPCDSGFRLITSKEGWEGIYQTESRKIDYLRSKFFKQLREKPGIYVVKANTGIDDLQARRLLSVLRSYNKEHVLLRVVSSDDMTFRQLDDGLYSGSVKEFAEYASANVFDQNRWMAILGELAALPEIKSLYEKPFA